MGVSVYDIINVFQRREIMGCLFILFCVLFVLSLPVLIAAVCNSDKKLTLISMFMAVSEVVCLVPLVIDRLGMRFPNFYIKFFDINIGIWLFFINLFIVIWFNRKKLSK